MEAIAAIVIFVLMFALIILDKIPRHYITLGCAAATLIIVFGVCMKSPRAIMETLNLKPSSPGISGLALERAAPAVSTGRPSSLWPV